MFVQKLTNSKKFFCRMLMYTVINIWVVTQNFKQEKIRLISLE